MYIGHVRLCVCLHVCLSLAAFSHYCTDPDVTWGNGRRCPIVVHCWADLQSVHGFRCYDNIRVCKLITLYTANAYSAEREMSASACTRSMASLVYLCASVLKRRSCLSSLRWSLWLVIISGPPILVFTDRAIGYPIVSASCLWRNDFPSELWTERHWQW